MEHLQTLTEQQFYKLNLMDDLNERLQDYEKRIINKQLTLGNVLCLISEQMKADIKQKLMDELDFENCLPK